MGSHINLDLTELILIYITWQGNLITDEYCILTNACQECQSVAVGTGIYNNTYNVNIIIVAPS